MRYRIEVVQSQSQRPRFDGDSGRSVSRAFDQMQKNICVFALQILILITEKLSNDSKDWCRVCLHCLESVIGVDKVDDFSWELSLMLWSKTSKLTTPSLVINTLSVVSIAIVVDNFISIA